MSSRFVEKLQYAKKILDDAKGGDEVRNAILGAANILANSEIGNQFRTLSDYAKEAENDDEISRLCERLSDELHDTIKEVEESF